MHQWILGVKHIAAKQNIILKIYYALKHIVNRLNDGTYYVNFNFNVCLHNNNLFHIYKYIKLTCSHAREEYGSVVHN